jgi:type II secretory pathway pseudopilin PulG
MELRVPNGDTSRASLSSRKTSSQRTTLARALSNGHEVTIINRCTPAATARRGGFTLIEVLGGGGCVGVLAAILLPVFSSAREASRTSACSSNLRQMHWACRCT